MPTNLERAALISRNVELESVTLVAANLASSVDPMAPPDEFEVSQQYRARGEVRESSVYVFVDFIFTAESSGEEDGKALELTSTYLLVYGLRGASDYPSDALEHFASLNGPYNAWPYWRELVQTVCGRAGIAAIVIPVFRPPVRELTPEEREQLHLGNILDQETGPSEEADPL